MTLGTVQVVYSGNRDDDWNAIKQLGQIAENNLKKEQSTRDWTKSDQLTRTRVEAYIQLVTALEKYKQNYFNSKNDKSSISYLKLLCRLGNCEELADHQDVAMKYYKECLSHPQINNKDVIYSGVTVKEYASVNLKKLEKFNPPDRGGGGGANESRGSGWKNIDTIW